MMGNLDKFEKIINFVFKNKSLLEESLTHKSFTVEENKNKHHNEKLEFLGDSILNFVIAEKLLLMFSDESEGVLSKKRAALVNHNKLAEVAKKFNLQNFMLFGPGEVKQGNHLNGRIQGSCIEALIGAIYLDSNYEITRDWVLKLFDELDFQVEIDGSYSSDYKSRLQELAQKKKLGSPVYEVLVTTGPSHKPNFLVSLKLNNQEICRAEGYSKKNAEQKAAEFCLNQMSKEEGKG